VDDCAKCGESNRLNCNDECWNCGAALASGVDAETEEDEADVIQRRRLAAKHAAAQDQGGRQVIFVAYNGYGDLIAEAYSLDSLYWYVAAAGYHPDDVMIGRVTP
jgi:hypothetical protein